jgi:hypothetical protein
MSIRANHAPHLERLPRYGDGHTEMAGLALTGTFLFGAPAYMCNRCGADAGICVRTVHSVLDALQHVSVRHAIISD